MRDNTKHLLQLLTEVLELPAPVLETGALQIESQESYADMRPYFSGRRYIGSDMRAGPGVDLLADAHRLPLRDGSAGTVLLLDTLEHVQSPFVAVQEAARVLKPGGVVALVSVMNFPIHAFPSDYWRFTPAAFDYLLGALAPRAVLSQGDAEFPHTVIGLGMQGAGSPEAAPAFVSGVEEVQTRWAEAAYGGPLLRYQPAGLVLAQRAAGRTLPPFERGRRIAQTFVCPANDLSRIDVRLSKPPDSPSCHLLFTLHEDHDAGQEVAAYRLFSPHIIDGTWTFIPLPVQCDSAGKRYRLTVESPDAAPGVTLSALASEATADGAGQLSIDGAPVEGSLCFQVYCRTPEGGVSSGALRETLRDTPAAQAGVPAGVQGWEQARYLASVLRSGFDGMRAELREVSQRLQELEHLQRESLAQSTEAAALVRNMKRSPVYRLWRRFLR